MRLGLNFEGIKKLLFYDGDGKWMNARKENMDWEMPVRKYGAKLIDNVMTKTTNGRVLQ